MKLELVTRRDVSYVELQRDKKHSIGITIADGTEEDSRPVVKSVQINSLAAKTFAVAKGDVILSVNGFSTTGKKSKDVRQMLDDAGSDVNLQVQYKTYESRIMGPSVYRKQKLTLRLQKIKDSFGFLLRKCSKYSFIMEYPIISNIKEGSLIYKRGHVQDGDRLLKIDNIDLSWMSLSYIASLLQAKDEAEFTFEYSVRVVNFAEMDKRIDLEIDAPVADLGISFRMCDEECSVMYISSLRQGSVAERCGIFSEGDVILSINDIDTKNLSVSKAYFLLRRVRKYRKISFISSRQADTPNESGLSSTGDTVSTESFISEIHSTDCKHVNTPVTPNFTFVKRQEYNFQNLYFIEQIQSVDRFQRILPVMSSVKQALSALMRQAFRGTLISVNQNCTSCNNHKHAVKLCTSCLARINVNCAQSMDVLRDLVTQFVRFSSNMFDENDDQLVNISLKNVTHMLRETLPNIFHVPELQEQLSILADKVSSVDTSCSTCEQGVKAVVLIVKQLLLILSIRDNSVEFTDLAEHLVCCLLEVKFPCCGYSGYIQNSDASETNYSSCEDLAETVCVEIQEDNLSVNTPSSHLKNNSDTDSNPISLESSFNTLKLKTEICHDYLKLTHIQSVSESKNSTSPTESSAKSNRHYKSCIETNTFPKEAAGETDLPSFLSDDLTGNRTKRFLNNMKNTKIWRSLDSLIKPGRFSNMQNFRRSKNRPKCSGKETLNTVIIRQNMCNITNAKNIDTDLNKNARSVSSSQHENIHSSNEDQKGINSSYKRQKISHSKSKMYQSSVNQPVRSNFYKYKKRIPLRDTASSNEENLADCNSGSTSSSSRCVDDKKYPTRSKQTYPDTNNLTLKNEGDGFGLGISDKSIINELPIIDAIEPKSPADKEGILKLGDRVLAINGAMTSNLSPEEFTALKNEALTARTITLRVEFDIFDEKYMFGSFDVVLEKSLKIGIIFKDVKKGAPLLVKGIVKGSAAHRSGQVFPGDEIAFMKYKKKAVFDPFLFSFTRERTVILTVMRDPKKILDMDREDTSDSEILNMANSHLSPSYGNSVSEIPDLRAPHPTPASSINSVSQVTVLRLPLKASNRVVPNMKTPNSSRCNTDSSSEVTTLRVPRKSSSHMIPNMKVSSSSRCSTDSSSEVSALKVPRRTSCRKVQNMRAQSPSLCSTNSVSQNAVLRALSKTSSHMVPKLRAPSPSLCSTNSVSDDTDLRTLPNTSSYIGPYLKAQSPSLCSSNSVSEATVPKTSCYMDPISKVSNMKTQSSSLCSTNSNSENKFLQALPVIFSHMIPNLRAPSPSLCSTNSVSEATVPKTCCYMDPIPEVPNIRVSSPSPRNTDQSSCDTNSCSQREENLPQNGENFVIKKTSVHQSHKNFVIVEHEVTLYRDSRCFDFGILLGQNSNTGRGYVKDIRPDGPADKSGVIQKNSRIVQVNGVLVQGNVYELFYRADHSVDLIIRRIIREDSDETKVKLPI